MLARVGFGCRGKRALTPLLLGPYTPLIEEVVDYARNEELFVCPYRGNRNSVLVETDFVKAQEFAWTQDPESGWDQRI